MMEYRVKREGDKWVPQYRSSGAWGITWSYFIEGGERVKRDTKQEAQAYLDMRKAEDQTHEPN